MDVLVLIDKLDDIIHNARSVPLTDSVMIDREEIYDILDQMRSTIPEEIKQARWIVKERQEMLSEAKQEAERVLAEAQDRAERLASETEVVRLAEKNAQQVMEDAREREREIRLGAEDYADEVLGNLEVNLDKFLAAVRRGRERLAGPRRRRAAAAVSRGDAARSVRDARPSCGVSTCVLCVSATPAEIGRHLPVEVEPFLSAVALSTTCPTAWSRLDLTVARVGDKLTLTAGRRDPRARGRASAVSTDAEIPSRLEASSTSATATPRDDDDEPYVVGGPGRPGALGPRPHRRGAAAEAPLSRRLRGLCPVCGVDLNADQHGH